MATPSSSSGSSSDYTYRNLPIYQAMEKIETELKVAQELSEESKKQKIAKIRSAIAESLSTYEMPYADLEELPKGSSWSFKVKVCADGMNKETLSLIDNYAKIETISESSLSELVKDIEKSIVNGFKFKEKIEQLFESPESHV